MRIAPGMWVTPTVRLVRPLGSGGMSTVWVAADMRLHTQVAVKLLAPQLLKDETARARFRREGRLPAQIQSPHLVQTYDEGVLPDAKSTPYIVMEWLEGETLKQRLGDNDRLAPRDAASVVTQLCRTLQKTHAIGVIHRDIKPDNVFLLRSDSDSILIKLLDFGVAKKLGKDVSFVTKTGETLGTPSYMSPEQLRHASSVDFRSDLWSVAVVAYRMLLGVKPFARDEFPALCLSICEGTFDAPSTHDPRWPAELDAWFARGLELDIEARFRSAEEADSLFCQALASLGDLQPDAARPELDEPTEDSWAEIPTLVRGPRKS